MGSSASEIAEEEVEKVEEVEEFVVVEGVVVVGVEGRRRGERKGALRGVRRRRLGSRSNIAGGGGGDCGIDVLCSIGGGKSRRKGC